MDGIMFVCMDVGVAAAYVCFVMEGIMFVCMDVGVAAAYVCFVMKGMLFVCMYVDIAAGGIPAFPNGKEFCLNALNIPSMNSRPLGRVRGGASPPADAVIATKAKPSEDAIGFLYLTPFCPIP